VNLKELKRDLFAFAKLFFKKDTKPYQGGIIKQLQDNENNMIYFLNKDGFSVYDMNKNLVQSSDDWETRYSAEDLKKLQEERMENEQMPTTITGATILGHGGYAVFGGIDPAVPQYHPVKIDRVANGFVIEIGCKKFVAEKWDDLAKKLAEYWKDPVAAQKKYCK
jgi:hypothetical protein